MTEQEWLTCDGPHRILKYLRPWRRHARKLRLYTCASCRSPTISPSHDGSCETLIDVVGLYADGMVDRKEYTSAKHAVRRMIKREQLAGRDSWSLHWGQILLKYLQLKELPGWCGEVYDVERFDYLSEEVRQRRAETRTRGLDVITEEQAIEAQREHESFLSETTSLLHDLFGNPFRPIVAEPLWQTPAVLQLAHAAYDERLLPSRHLEPARLAVLADALEEVGCTAADLLGHLRGPGPHVRGCWAVDLILAKS